MRRQPLLEVVDGEHPLRHRLVGDVCDLHSVRQLLGCASVCACRYLLRALQEPREDAEQHVLVAVGVADLHAVDGDRVQYTGRHQPAINTKHCQVPILGASIHLKKETTAVGWAGETSAVGWAGAGGWQNSGKARRACKCRSRATLMRSPWGPGVNSATHKAEHMKLPPLGVHGGNMMANQRMLDRLNAST